MNFSLDKDHYELKKVQEKFIRRINRFYKSIKIPTLFIRYISIQEDYEWISSNLKLIDNILKSYNINNHIIYIIDERVNIKKWIPDYTVHSDKKDWKCNHVLKQNQALKEYLLNSIDIEHHTIKNNIKRYKINKLTKFPIKIPIKIKHLKIKYLKKLRRKF